MVFLLFSLSALFLLLALHPFITYPLTLRLLRRWYYRPIKQADSGQNESYAICVCAYNEEAVIAQKVENMLALRRVLPNLDILVYVDAATDRTAEMLRPYEDRIKVHISAERHGKTYGMNLLVSMTQASIVIFTDANVIFDVDSLRLLPRYFADREVGCVCGHLKYVNEGESVTASTGSLYWRLEEYIRQLESDTGSLMGADGAIFAIRRVFHKPLPPNSLDDMYLSMSILCDGHRMVRAPDVLAYERSVPSASEEFKRKVRIGCQAFSAHRQLWPRLRKLDALNVYKYVSHKLLRWFVIYWLVLSGVFFEGGMAAMGNEGAGILLALLGGAVLATGFLLKIPKVLQLIDILGAFAGTGIGVLQSLRGTSFQTWAPATSIRNK